MAHYFAGCAIITCASFTDAIFAGVNFTGAMFIRHPISKHHSIVMASGSIPPV